MNFDILRFPGARPVGPFLTVLMVASVAVADDGGGVSLLERIMATGSSPEGRVVAIEFAAAEARGGRLEADRLLDKLELVLEATDPFLLSAAVRALGACPGARPPRRVFNRSLLHRCIFGSHCA